MIKTYEISMAEKYGGKTLTVDIDMNSSSHAEYDFDDGEGLWQCLSEDAFSDDRFKSLVPEGAWTSRTQIDWENLKDDNVDVLLSDAKAKGFVDSYEVVKVMNGDESLIKDFGVSKIDLLAIEEATCKDSEDAEDYRDLEEILSNKSYMIADLGAAGPRVTDYDALGEWLLSNGVVTEENIGENYAKSKNGLFVKVKGRMIYIEVD